MKAALATIFSLLLLVSIQAAGIPNYHNNDEANYNFSEVCEDGSATANFLQKDTSDTYYMVYETVAKSAVVLVRVIWFETSGKIAGIDYYIKAAGAESAKVDEAKWLSDIKKNAPEYLLYMNGKSKKCKVTSSPPKTE